MKWIRRYNESKIIKATDENIKEIVSNEIMELGIKCNLNHIDVSQITDMNYLFWGSQFNGNISRWDVRNVLDMSFLFYESPFNGDISNWNVGNVTNMDSMFSYSSFNGDISRWDVHNVTDMNGMFLRSEFNGDISNWNVVNVQDMNEMFHISPLKGREPWWYILSPIFNGDNYSMYDSLDFGWIDFNEKIIYREKLIKTLKRGYNTKWNGELPGVFGFTYNP